MRNAIVLSAVLGVLAAGPATAAWAGTYYNNFSGVCDAGDTTLPAGHSSGFHCYHAVSVSPTSDWARKRAAIKDSSKVGLPALSTAPKAAARPGPAPKAPLPTGSSGQ